MDRNTVIDTLQQRGWFITTGEVKSRGEYEQLRRAIEDGMLMRLRNGIYVEMSALANNMIDVERFVPHGVLCLYSAFAHYGHSTQMPFATYIAIKAKRKGAFDFGLCQNRMFSGGFLEGKLYFPWILSNFAENILHYLCRR